jgi:glycosyltransferase involved in cell wall biosynthesis
MAEGATAHDDADVVTSARRQRTITVALVLEQHLGHRTYAENLEHALSGEPDLRPVWVPVRYAAGPWWIERVPLPGAVRAVARARREMRSLAGAGADVHVFNTQVPAVIGSRRARAVPYVVVTDVTPRQYDRIAGEYGHRADRGPVRALKHAWNRRVLTGASHAVAWSSWARASYVDDYGIPVERTSVIPPGVDTSRFEPAPRDAGGGSVRILFVGGDFERKGGFELLEAAAGLPAGVAEIVLVTKTVGEQAVAVPGVTVRVIDDLAPNDDRLVRLFRDSDVFVLPTRAEAFGIAAAEAGASGLPVIATAVGGLSDIVVDGETGITVAPGDVAALTSALRTLVADRDLRLRYGAAARARAVALFDAGTNAGRLLEIVRRSAES